MRPLHETVEMPDKLFPINVFKRSSKTEYVFVHPHWHEEIEILYVIKGTGTQQVNDRIFNIRKGDIVIVGSGDIHSTYTEREKDSKILVLLFSKDIMMPVNYLSPERKVVESFSSNMEFPDTIDSASSSGKNVLSSIIGIREEFNNKNDAYEIFIKARICELTGLLTRYYCVNRNKSKNNHHINKAKEILKSTFELIDKNYSTDITLEQAAEASSLSVSHFSRLFKKSTGRTFKDYLLFYRVNRVEELLSSRLSITEIAYECGFNSMATFIRAFKRYKGCTPSEYRKL